MLVSEKGSDPQIVSWLARSTLTQALVAPIGDRFLVVAKRLGVEQPFGTNDEQLFDALANHSAIALENAT